jgi:hypothetical protein
MAKNNDAASTAALAVVGREKQQAELVISEQLEKEKAIAQIFEMSGKIKAVAFFEIVSRL